MAAAPSLTCVGRRAIEIGCGVGQYVIKSLTEHAPSKIVAYNMTESVDTLRRIVIARYPAFLDKILFVQGSVFSMPFRPGSFDYVYSLGVLHHTGDTKRALRCAANLAAEGGQLNVWVYAASQYHIDTREPARTKLSGWLPLDEVAHGRLQARAWYIAVCATDAGAGRSSAANIFVGRVVHACQSPLLRTIARLIMSPPPHPSRDYRQINLFDGYVNAWAENWSEAELFPVLRDCAIAIKGISAWRVGFWGVKDSQFYATVNRMTRPAG